MLSTQVSYALSILYGEYLQTDSCVICEEIDVQRFVFLPDVSGCFNFGIVMKHTSECLQVQLYAFYSAYPGTWNGSERQ